MKKLIRGTAFAWEDFFLGIDLTMAALATAFVNVLDLIEPVADPHSPPVARHVGEIAVWYIVGCFIAFILLIAFHQDYARKRAMGQNFSRRGEVFFLGFASNVIGVALLGFFMLLKMRGKL